MSFRLSGPLERARARWPHDGSVRPAFAIEPAAGQESVWDYPRPPRLEAEGRRVEVFCGDGLVARSDRALRYLETASPPTIYVPPQDVNSSWLRAATGSSLCEWKGRAVYWDVVVGATEVPRGAWSYPEPLGPFAPIAGWFSFYPARFSCFLGREAVRPQPGEFYGGWMTDEIVGPVKGEPGTGGW